MTSDPYPTLRDARLDIASELSAAGFDNAVEIGSGSFGTVYSCYQERLDRVVAVKVLNGTLSQDRQRFFREQRAMGQLTGHPNIVGVLQVGETASGYPFLVMQYHRQGSLQERICDFGSLGTAEVMRLGVRLAGALESAHAINILHRDVKPANILYTDFGEPALSDFGIARVDGAFETAEGVFAGSPAFTAPEILGGEAPSPASDVYGLGAVLFCALTGHAVFNRRKGEQLVAQFLRSGAEDAPNLHAAGIPDDLCAVIESAISRDPRERPSAMQLGQEIQRIQAARGWPVDELAFRGQPQTRAGTIPGARLGPSTKLRAARTPGNLPLDLTSFVGRRAELSEVESALSASRLVTLTGFGGVGKTRLALRAAAAVRDGFTDGAWLAELAEVRDGALLVDVLAAALGLREEPGRPLDEVLVDFLSSRMLLLVLDNCEQVVDEAAKLAERLLLSCPDLRILATSREALDIGAELVLPVSPLVCPEADDPAPGRLAGYDAVALFAERAAACVRDFRLTEDNEAIVARICARLDGLPLAIELAAARLRTMSVGQILDGLADRYTLLSRGRRDSPARQQNLTLSVEWSYDLCSPAEQQLWCRLSVFGGSFDLVAAREICADREQKELLLLDVVSSLVEKSILIRFESMGLVRFRFLETLREYGRARIRDTDEYLELRRRHAAWYLRLVSTANDQWISPAQADWLNRLHHEIVDIREALEFSLSDDGSTALSIAVYACPYLYARGLLSEGRRWLDRVLAAAPEGLTPQRCKALYYATLLAGLQGDVPAATARNDQLCALVRDSDDTSSRVAADVADGLMALYRGDLSAASGRLDNAVEQSTDLTTRIIALMILGWVHELQGELSQSLVCNEEVLNITEIHGESMFRSYVLYAIGVAKWRDGDCSGAAVRLEQGLRLAYELDDASTAAACIGALAWLAGRTDQSRRAAVMLAAAKALRHTVHTSSFELTPGTADYEAECEDSARRALGAQEYDAAWTTGTAMNFGEAVAFALAE